MLHDLPSIHGRTQKRTDEPTKGAQASGPYWSIVVHSYRRQFWAPTQGCRYNSPA